MSVEKYNTVNKIGEALYKEKGSKFIGQIFPCTNEIKAKSIIESLRKKHPNAVHVCFAWRFGINEYYDRFSDDGEPNNSAGKPIFGQIINAELTNVLVTVTRYYGGTKLGVGGLISAYKKAASEAINATKIIEKELHYTRLLRYTFEETGNANVMLAKNQIDVLENGYDDKGPFIKFTAPKHKLEIIENLVHNLPNISLTEKK